MTSSNAQLKQLLSTYVQMPSEKAEQLFEHATSITIAADAVLMQVGQIPRYFYVVNSGLLRAVLISNEGKEYSKEFYWEKDVIFGMRSMISDQPLPYSVISVEPCRLFRVPIQHYRQLVESYSAWKDYHIRQLNMHLLHKEVKEELLLLNSNEQRVQQMYQRYPDLVQRVPATLVASYLGLNPVSLSRIKKRLALK